MENGELIGFDESLALRECKSDDYDLLNFSATGEYTKDRVIEMLGVSWCLDNPSFKCREFGLFLFIIFIIIFKPGRECS